MHWILRVPGLAGRALGHTIVALGPCWVYTLTKKAHACVKHWLYLFIAHRACPCLENGVKECRHSVLSGPSPICPKACWPFKAPGPQECLVLQSSWSFHKLLQQIGFNPAQLFIMSQPLG